MPCPVQMLVLTAATVLARSEDASTLAGLAALGTSGLLVATLDGGVHGFHNDGTPAWHFSLGVPLIDLTLNEASVVPSEASDIPLLLSDGSLFLSKEGNITHTRASIRDIVNAPPFQARAFPGVFITGERLSQIHAIELPQVVTGRPATPHGRNAPHGGNTPQGGDTPHGENMDEDVLHTTAPEHDINEKLKAATKWHPPRHEDPARKLFFGSTRWRIFAVDGNTNDEKWSLTFHEILGAASGSMPREMVDHWRGRVDIDGRLVKLHLPVEECAVDENEDHAVAWSRRSHKQTLTFKSEVFAAFAYTIPVNEPNLFQLEAVAHAELHTPAFSRSSSVATYQPAANTSEEDLPVTLNHVTLPQKEVPSPPALPLPSLGRSDAVDWVCVAWALEQSWTLVQLVKLSCPIMEHSTSAFTSLMQISVVCIVCVVLYNYFKPRLHSMGTNTTYCSENACSLEEPDQKGLMRCPLQGLMRCPFMPNAVPQVVLDALPAAGPDAVSVAVPGSKSPVLSCAPSSLRNGHFGATFSDVSMIAAGSFGVVFRAKHRLGKSFYAVKFVPIVGVGEVEDVQNRGELCEVQNLALLTCKHVVRYVTCWVEEPHCLPPEVSTAGAFTRMAEATRAIRDNFPKSSHAVATDPSFDHSARFLNNGSESVMTRYGCGMSNSSYQISSCPGSRSVLFQEDSCSSARRASRHEQSCQKLGTLDEADVHFAQPPVDRQSYEAVLVLQMEFCGGPTLRQWLDSSVRERTPLRFTRTATGEALELRFAKHLLKGIWKIHAAQLVHRDLKPQNLFVTSDAVLKVGDFGLSRNMCEHFKEEKGAVGTPAYTAPEGGAHAKPAADVFSAALIILELLCPPFTTMMERAVVLGAFRHEHELPEHINNKMVGCARLLRDMACHDPSGRPSAEVAYATLKHMEINLAHDQH